MSTITSQTIPGTLRDGLDALFGVIYNNIESEWPMFYEQKTSTRQFEEHQGLTGLNNPSFKKEGEPMRQLSAGQGFVARYMHQILAGYFAITKQAYRDGRYGSQSARYLQSMGMGFNEVKEINGASIFNNAYASDAIGGDGKSLLNNAHPTPGQSGQTWSNVFGNAGSQLSYEALRAVLLALPQMLTDSGQHAGIRAESLCVHQELEFDAEEVVKSALRPGTMNNNLNAIMSTNKLPGGIKVSTFFTDPEFWCVQTNCPEGLCYYQRDEMEPSMEGDFETGNLKFGEEERFSFGWTDSRAIAGPVRT